MGKRTLGFIAALLLTSPFLRPDLIVKQMSDGRIVLSNSLDMVTSSKARMGRRALPSNPSIYERYRQPVRETAQRFGLREDLALAVARAESSFNPFAISPKGAVGIMQLMHETAMQYGVSDRFNALQNIEAGIRHLTFLMDKYRGDLTLTLAAYNAGAEAVARYNGVPPYAETRGYIRRVLSYMGMATPDYATPGKARTPIYKLTTPDGRMIITDSPPSSAMGYVEVIR
jgi:soluble lytic murein transglycosylase-like protein